MGTWACHEFAGHVLAFPYPLFRLDTLSAILHRYAFRSVSIFYIGYAFDHFEAKKGRARIHFWKWIRARPYYGANCHSSYPQSTLDTFSTDSVASANTRPACARSTCAGPVRDQLVPGLLVPGRFYQPGFCPSACTGQVGYSSSSNSMLMTPLSLDARTMRVAPRLLAGAVTVPLEDSASIT